MRPLTPYLDNLIRKYANGTLSETEFAELENWKEYDEENRKLFYKKSSDYVLNEVERKPAFPVKKVLMVTGSIAAITLLTMGLLTVKQDEGQKHVRLLAGQKTQQGLKPDQESATATDKRAVPYRSVTGDQELLAGKKTQQGQESTNKTNISAMPYSRRSEDTATTKGHDTSMPYIETLRQRHFLNINGLTQIEIVEAIGKWFCIPVVYQGGKSSTWQSKALSGNIGLDDKIENIIATLKSVKVNVRYDGERIIAGE